MTASFPLVVKLKLSTVKYDSSLFTEEEYAWSIEKSLDAYFNAFTYLIGIEKGSVILHFQIWPPEAFALRLTLLSKNNDPMEIDWIDGQRVPFTLSIPAGLTWDSAYSTDPRELLKICPLIHKDYRTALLTNAARITDVSGDFHENMLKDLEERSKISRTRKYVPLELESEENSL